MIAHPPVSSSPNLPAALAARARAASDGRLALDAAVGVAVAVSFAHWRPTAWVIGLCVGAALASFGVWGIAEREVQDRAQDLATGRRVVRALRALQAISICAGVGAALLAAFVLLGIALGTIIS